MPQLFDELKDRRAIIDRRELSDSLMALEGEDLRPRAVAMLAQANAFGRGVVETRLLEHPMAGHQAAAGYAYLTDQLLRALYDFTVEKLYPNPNRTEGERIAIAAVGGYGRGEMATFSDVDLAFLIPWKQTSWTEQVIESMLYSLWDLGLKVGHSIRSLDEMVRYAKADLTIRTALLEGRFVWGDERLYDEASVRFYAEVAANTDRSFVRDKLAEREARHKRMGDSRYVVEPNLKEGKGGLRDLHTLFWIGKYVYRVRSLPELVDKGLLTKPELQQFRKAANFLWAVRCHLHLLAGRAEDRLTFDFQREIAASMRYTDRPGKSAVERFMQHYFLTAKQVGDLTGVFLAHLDESSALKARRFNLPSFRRAPRKLNGFVLDRGKLAIPDDGFFQSDPVRLIELFALADQHKVEIHPLTLRSARRDAKLIDAKVREDKRANALFMDVLTSKNDPETVLRWMNEATILGHFVPDFGRVVAQMQFDMYHHYTVDEHSIRAIGLLSDIEKGNFKEDHPLSTAITQQIISRRVLYVAVLLHDIAKGRGGDHSVLGAEVAERLCPRLGLTSEETETVAWLVRWHLLMSATAFKRDVNDPKTVTDFVASVQSMERLRLLLVVTVVDIRAVGPGVWNGWKRQLLSDLFNAAEEVLRLGHMEHGRKERVDAKKAAVEPLASLLPKQWEAISLALPDSYWVAEAEDVIASNMRLMAEAGDTDLAISAVPHEGRAGTLVTIYAADHPGLFYRMAGAISVVGANIIDARIHTTKSGMALDNFLVQDPTGQPFADLRQLERLERSIRDALSNKKVLADALAARPLARRRAEHFHVEPRILIDNKASNRLTVIEINAQDRPALLYALARALFNAKATIRSAHVATYGERAVDTFYVTDLLGTKIDDEGRLARLEASMIKAAKEPVAAKKKAA